MLLLKIIFILTVRDFSSGYDAINIDNQHYDKFLKSEDPRILKIRKWYQEIRKGISEKRYASVSDGSCQSGGMYTYFYDKSTQKLVLVTFEAFGDGYNTEEEYYIRNEKLFFYYSNSATIHEREPLREGVTELEAWRSGEIYNAKNYKCKQKRVYFDKNEIIRFLKKESIIESVKDVDKEMQAIQNISQKYEKAYVNSFITQVEDFIKEFNDLKTNN